MSVNTQTGLLSGTPSQIGTFNIGLTATNPFGTAQKTLALSIRLPAAPVITSAQNGVAVLNDPFTYQITGVSNPTSFGASGLPSGLSVNTSNGLITGTPTTTGIFNVILSATNLGGTGMRGLLLTVNSSGPLSTLVWNAIDSPQKAGIPFAATLEAHDAQGRTVREFNGGFTIKGQGPGSTAAIVLITECGTRHQRLLRNRKRWEYPREHGGVVHRAECSSHGSQRYECCLGLACDNCSRPGHCNH
jgi:hypothetical protein